MNPREELIKYLEAHWVDGGVSIPEESIEEFKSLFLKFNEHCEFTEDFADLVVEPPRSLETEQ